MNVFDWLADQLTSKQDKTFALIGQKLQSNCTIGFTITLQILSIHGWLKITIACAFDWLGNCFGFPF